MDPTAYEVICDSTTDREAWLEHRRTMVTASDMAAILGCNPWHGALEVYMDKIGMAAPVDENEAMEWGHELEEPVARAFGRRTNRHISMEGKLLRSVAHPRIGSTLDARQQIDDAPWFPLEIKTTGIRGIDEWEDGCPAWYMAQVQTQMLVTADAHASIACLIAGQRMVWQDIDADPEMQAAIVEAVGAFWQRVEDGNPPDPGPTKAAHEALLRLYPQGDPKKIVALDQEAVGWDDRIAEIADAMKALNLEDLQLRNLIEARIGAAEKGVLPGGLGSWTWKNRERAAYRVKACAFRELRRGRK